MSTDSTSSAVTTASPSRLVGQAGLVAVAMTLGNLLAYALQLVAARSLGRNDYGILASLLGVLVVGYVVSLGLQTVTTRRLASRAPGGTPVLCATAVRASVVTGAACAVLAVPLAVFLRLDGPLPVLAVALALVPLTWTGYVFGVAQGHEQFGRLAAAICIAMGCRFAGGLVALALGAGPTGVLLATAVGTFLGAAAATLVVREAAVRPETGGGAVLSETFHASHALLALYVLTNLDLLLARHELTGDESGLYAVGAVLTKVAFWLPQFIVVVALPSLADERRRRRATGVSVGLVVASGLLVTGVTAFAGDLAVLVVGGSEYESLASDAWWFALLGSVYALVQLLLMSSLAREERRAVVVLWSAVACLAFVVLVLVPASVTAIVWSAIATAVLLAAVAAVVTARRISA